MSKTSEQTRLILERLDKIIERMDTAQADVAHCPHGYTGICMSCIARDDLMRPRT